MRNKLMFIFASAIALVMFNASVAFACHPEIVASIDCSGKVSFTSTAWAGKTDASRTNSAIEISYTVSGTTHVLPQKASYKFDKGNGFSFSDSFTISPLPKTITVTAKAIATWGNGVKDGSQRSTTVGALGNCGTSSTSSTTAKPTTTTTKASTTTRPSNTSTTGNISSSTTKPGVTTTILATTTVPVHSSSSIVHLDTTIPPSPPTALAATGAHIGATLAVAGVFIGLGLVLISVRRRDY